MLKTISVRLKNPKVIVGILAQITTVIVLMTAKIDNTIGIGIITATCSVLTGLGIVSDPNQKKLRETDIIKKCPTCGGNTCHVEVAGRMLCKVCGEENKEYTSAVQIRRIKKDKNK